MEITIDKNSGYCFGVEFAIQMAEDELKDSGRLFCLGDIVHNAMEVARLNKQGLEIINHDDLRKIKNAKVLIRAHGEPPETYQIALENNIELIDASCPVVLKLQNRVNKDFRKMEDAGGQLVIYGKKGHAEVVGLTGQTNNKAIVVMEEEDLDEIDYSKPITLYSQTTKSTSGFYNLKSKIEGKIEAENNENSSFKANDSICRQVSNREPNLRKFAAENDVILFVSGKKSSNGKALYAVCKEYNDRSYFIENEDDLQANWFRPEDKVGICGATSTPTWLMEQVKGRLDEMA
jgi:4-hydroxy-3-methylbut-2-enyl diphosphate reductase